MLLPAIVPTSTVVVAGAPGWANPATPQPLETAMRPALVSVFACACPMSEPSDSLCTMTSATS